MNLNEAAALFGYSESAQQPITGVSIDSRRINPGNLFVALKGEQFDGHEFVTEAQNKGALAALVQKKAPNVSIPQWVVADTAQALGVIAAAHRQKMKCRAIALTGSNGKTTVKEMIAACLPPPSLATQGNLNNHLGVPLSLLNMTPEHRYAVFELGANHLGEIAYTVGLVQPEVTLINNIAPAHIQGFGTLEGVAKAKGEIHQGLSAGGTAVINDDDAFAHFWDDCLKGKKVLRFSATRPADISIRDLAFDAQQQAHFTLVCPQGTCPISLRVPGMHHVTNALAAAGCCLALGVDLQDIQHGLTHFAGVKGRLTMLPGRNDSLVIDDTYNANLRSVLTALEVLAKRPGKRIFVFGDMGELGEFATLHHQEVGRAASQLGIDQLMSCGAYSMHASKAFGALGHHFSSKEALVAALLNELDAQTTVLVKGSRSSAMERVVNQVLQA